MKITLAALSLSIIATSAFAAGEGPGSHFVENWDLNEDGKVTLAEATERRDDVFVTFDADDDGRIDAGEYKMFDEARAADMEGQNGHGNGPMKTAEAGMHLAYNDVDDDGVVSREEFLARAPDWFAEMDRNGKMIRPVAGLANWASRKDNKVTRPVMEKVAGIDATAELPTFAGKTLMMRAKQAEKQGTLAPAADGKATGRKAALFATCNGNYNNPQMGEAALKVLARQGVTAKPVYPGCCGMPFLEQADLERVAEQARKVSKDLRPLVDEGWDIVTLIASCGLMMKFEWPLILPDDENVQALSKAVKDIDEYIVDIARNEGLAEGMKPLSGDVAVHLACHARAQNMGAKAVELLRLIPEAKVTPVERCAGHGGTFGVLKSTHDVAMKVGKTAARNISKAKPEHVVSECPLALKHLMQEIEELGLVEEGKQPPASAHPIELIAQAYGL